MTSLIKDYQDELEALERPSFSYHHSPESVRKHTVYLNTLGPEAYYVSDIDHLAMQCNHIESSLLTINYNYSFLRDLKDGKQSIISYDHWADLFHALCRLKYFAHFGHGCDDTYWLIVNEGLRLLKNWSKDHEHTEKTHREYCTVCQMFLEILDHLPIEITSYDRSYFDSKFWTGNVRGQTDQAVKNLIKVAQNMQSNAMLIKIAQFQKDHIDDLLDIDSFFEKHKKW